MCGIAGIFGNHVSPSDITNMLPIISRRGPECTNVKSVSQGVIAHASLAFVEEGNNPQPFFDDAGTIIFNGEIYNWRELNDEYNLASTTDTQVLLRGLVKCGISFLNSIDGQFAFIAQFLNKDNVNVTLVGRDKYGISPLLFGEDDTGRIVIASTGEALEAGGVTRIKSVPAGAYGYLQDGKLNLEYWFQLPKVDIADQVPIEPSKVLSNSTGSVVGRIPDRTEILFTAMGGIDSQFVTTTVARHTRGRFGGAITVVPWRIEDPTDLCGGDYHQAKASVGMLKNEGIEINHYVVQLTPEYVEGAIDRLLKLLGPDFFNICCALAEDLVASTAKQYGGKAIMTAGGPDEAGRSYKPWTVLHRDEIEEGFYAICDQFASAEGVRAGLVFGEHGIENRVPLAFLIEDFMFAPPSQKQKILSWGDDQNPFSISMLDKICWRQAVAAVLPNESLIAPKETIHGAAGSSGALMYVILTDNKFKECRLTFIAQVKRFGWASLIHGNVDQLNPYNPISEGQLYCLWRWSQLEPELFNEGATSRYGDLSYRSDLASKVGKPICHEWQITPSAKEKMMRSLVGTPT